MTSPQPSPLYPLPFEPIYQYRIWGGRRLAKLLSAPLPGEEPIGEAWLLSDREDHASVVGEGSLKGLTLGQLLKRSPRESIEGEGYLEHEGNTYAFGKGDVLLLPAVVGACVCQPKATITVLEISLPETT